VGGNRLGWRFVWSAGGSVTRETPQQAESRSAHGGDDALVDACLGGQRGAWEALVRAYATLVYAIPRRMGLTQDEAEDVSQAVFTALLGALPTLRDGQSLAKWLIVVAKRQSWKVIRGRDRVADSSVAERIEAGVGEGGDQVWERRQAVRRGLEALGGRCQELLTALFMCKQKPDYNEVSGRLGIPVGSIGPTRNRCLKKLMEVLGSQAGGLWDEQERETLRGAGPAALRA